MRNPMGRRSFLQAASGMVAFPFVNELVGKKAGDKSPQGLRLGAQSYTFRNFVLEKALQQMKKLGLKYGEFYSYHCPMTDKPTALNAFKNLCKEYDVTPWAWGVQRFTKDHDDNKRVFVFAKELGLKMLSADPSPDSFESLDKLCEEFQIAVGIHPHGPVGKGVMHYWYSAEVILKAVKDHHPLIGSCLDTGHLIRAAQLGKKLDPANQIRLMGKRNFGIHLKDHDNKRHTDVVFGKGTLDLVEVIKALREVKFSGLIAIEYEASPENPFSEVQDCVKVFNEGLKSA